MRARFTVSIEKNLKTMLYDHVKGKYQGLRGGLSVELEAAISAYLESTTRNIAHKNLTPGISRIERTVESILRTLHENGFSKDFNQSEFEMACSKVAGGDKRTVQKYLKWAVKLGIIKHQNGAIWSFKTGEVST